MCDCKILPNDLIAKAALLKDGSTATTVKIEAATRSGIVVSEATSFPNYSFTVGMIPPGAWTDFPLNTGVTASTGAGYRSEIDYIRSDNVNATTIRFKGALTMDIESLTTKVICGYLPVGARPESDIKFLLPAEGTNLISVMMIIESSGTMKVVPTVSWTTIEKYRVDVSAINYEALV